MRNLIIAAGLSVIAAGAALAHHAGDTFKVGEMVVSHAWSYETAGMGHASKVYLTLENTGETTDRLVEASVAFAPRVLMQAQTVAADSSLAIEDLEAIDVGPGQTLTLQPGAMWLEVDEVRASFRHGQFFTMELVFEQAGPVTIDVVVEEADEHDHQPAS